MRGVLLFVVAACFLANAGLAGNANCEPRECPNQAWICPTHPDIDKTLSGIYKPPYKHPPVHVTMSKAMPKDHPNIDNYLATGTRYNGDHMRINGYMAYFKNCTCGEVPEAHPNIVNALKRGDTVPAGHPVTHTMFGQYTKNHPDVDAILLAKKAIPIGHVDLASYLCVKKCTNCTCVEFFPAHPNIDNALARGDPLPTNPPHVLVHDMFGDKLRGHRNVDQLLKDKIPIPLGHPKIMNSTCLRPCTTCKCVDVPFAHTDLLASVTRGDALPANHKPVHVMFGDNVKGHRNIDEIYANKIPLPKDHPVLVSPYVCKATSCLGTNCKCADLPFAHPDIAAAMARGDVLPKDHKPIHEMFGDNVLGHRNIDQIYADKTPLPKGHPDFLPPLVCRSKECVGPACICVDVPFAHPDVAAAMARGDALPKDHKPIHPMFGDMVKGHRNIDEIYLAKTPLPKGHPELVEPILCRPADCTSVNCTKADALPAHPNIDLALRKKTKLPVDHVKVHESFGDYLVGHRNVDELMKAGTALPVDHPWIGNYTVAKPCLLANCTKAVLFPAHPLVDEALARGDKLPVDHPKMHPLFGEYLRGHLDVDVLMANNVPFPKNHPVLKDEYIVIEKCSNCTCVSIMASHPAIEAALLRGDPIPVNHPILHPLFGANLKGHRDLDELMKLKVPFPANHPPLAEYTCRREGSEGQACAMVMSDHPNVDEAIARGDVVPAHHPLVNGYFGTMLSFHKNVDQLMKDNIPLPLGHPLIDNYMCQRSQFTPAMVLSSLIGGTFFLAALVRWSWKLYKAPTRARAKKLETEMANDLRKSGMFDAEDKEESDFFDDKYRQSNMAEKVRAQSLSNGTANALPDPSRGGPPPPPPPMPPTGQVPVASWSSNHQDDVIARGLVTPPVPPPPPRHLKPVPLPSRDLYAFQTMQQHANHVDTSFFAAGEVQELSMSGAPRNGAMMNGVTEELDDDLLDDIITKQDIQDKMNTNGKVVIKQVTCWKRTKVLLFGYRIPYTEWTSENLLLVMSYLTLNILVLWYARHFGTAFDKGWGSLAAANTMLVIVPATRNSVLTWVMGLPFDHVVLYHRFMGRFTIFCVCMHFAYYFTRFLETPLDWTFATGAGAMLCGLTIFVTSLDYMRRKKFQIFFFGHYFFLGFFSLGYIHVKPARIYLLIGMILYGFDRFLRTLWTLTPQTMRVFRNRGDEIAQVRFKKNVFTRMLGMHKVGQYYFVNFPALSLHEWHPFSVSSGPREEAVELHIRALGDHTKKIVALATERSASNHPGTWIRIDGPYGRHDFNFRRYPVLLLVGGGVGVTPVMGMMKDIYNVGELNAVEKKRVVVHSNKVVYCMWVMPAARDYDCFADDLALCLKKSKMAHYPKLRLLVYITRAKKEDNLPEPLTAGRPDFVTLFNEINTEYHKQASLVFACGPGAIVNQLWDQSVKRSAKGTLMHFHHETFEF